MRVITVLLLCTAMMSCASTGPTTRCYFGKMTLRSPRRYTEGWELSRETFWPAKNQISWYGILYSENQTPQETFKLTCHVTGDRFQCVNAAGKPRTKGQLFGKAWRWERLVAQTRHANGLLYRCTGRLGANPVHDCRMLDSQGQRLHRAVTRFKPIGGHLCRNRLDESHRYLDNRSLELVQQAEAFATSICRCNNRQCIGMVGRTMALWAKLNRSKRVERKHRERFQRAIQRATRCIGRLKSI